MNTRYSWTARIFADKFDGIIKLIIESMLNELLDLDRDQDE
jgi:hypothetical protein